jgi:uncharacterized membrane protein
MAERAIHADRFEKVLALSTILMLVVTLVAVLKGRAEWGRIETLVWLHLATLAVSLCLTPVMLLRRRGDLLHRLLGWMWSLAMLATALFSLGIRQIAHGGFSVIHILSFVVLVTVPLLVWRARTHRVDLHRRAVRALVATALLTAGFFTFPFDRLMGHWLFG